MEKKSLISISCIISTLILGIAVAYVISMNPYDGTLLKAISDVTELGDPVSMPDVRNSTFSVAVVVENVTGLYGLDVQLNWTTKWITYLGHTSMIPVEDYPNPIPPSPYAGIIHEPYMRLKDVVNEADNIPGAEPGVMAWFAYSSQFGAPEGGFNGSGTICVLDFNVTDQPFSYDGSVTIKIHFVATGLSSPAPAPIPHTAFDLDITLHPIKFEYPPSPMLKVDPDLVTGLGINETFSLDVWLLGADGGDLDAWWDVAGCDFYLNFNTTLIEGLDVTIDPDDDFASFWTEGILHEEPPPPPDNAEGYVHVYFFGWGEQISPVNGTIRIASIAFNVIYESELYPEEPIILENPLEPAYWYILDAEGGIIDLSTPVTTEWLTIFPTGRYNLGFNLTDWEDVDGDGELSQGDQVILLNKDTLKGHDYYVNRTAGTLQLAQLPFQTIEDYVWPASFGMDGLANCELPGKYVGTDDPYGGFGVPYWTGNFSTAYGIASVNQIDCTYLPFTADNYTVTLTEGVDYIVHPDDDLIELLVPQDTDIINEHWVDGVNNTLNGWPAIGYVASGIESVYVDMHNGTARYGRNLGYENEVPSEWWYDPDWPWELEGWWALGFYQGNWTWPDGSEWWINYTAASYLTIDYNADPDPKPYYVEFEGDYTDFLALGDPVNTSWHEIYPWYCHSWNVTVFDDVDSSSDATIGDVLTLNRTDGFTQDYRIDAISTDIQVIRKPCVQDEDPSDPFYTDPVIVEIVGIPHPERPMSPWYGSSCSVPLPNAVENGAFQAIPELNSLFLMLLLLLSATVAIVTTRKLPKEK